MTPTHYTVKGDTTHFHYKPSEIIAFVRAGKKDGNVGPILVRRIGNWVTWKGYGTIENPRTELHSITLQHYEPFNGPMPTDDERLNPPKPIPYRIGKAGEYPFIVNVPL